MRVRRPTAVAGPPPLTLPPPLVSLSRQASLSPLVGPLCRLGEELGRGAFGQVYLGLDTRTGQHVAIKQLSLERIPGDSLQVGPFGGSGCCVRLLDDDVRGSGSAGPAALDVRGFAGQAGELRWASPLAAGCVLQQQHEAAA